MIASSARRGQPVSRAGAIAIFTVVATVMAMVIMPAQVRAKPTATPRAESRHALSEGTRPGIAHPGLSGRLRTATRRASIVQQGSEITPAGEAGKQQFGSDVAISGDGNTAVVAAEGNQSVIPGIPGGAWIFTRSKGVWTQRAQLREPSKFGSERVVGNDFGSSVAISGDGSTVFVSDDNGYLANASGTGVVWQYSRSSGWNEVGPPIVPDPDIDTYYGQFGSTLAISTDGSTAIMSGIDLTSGTPGTPAAWGFFRSGSNWTEQGPSMSDPSWAAERDHIYSLSLSSDGDTALIGTPTAKTGQAGWAWVFARTGSTWNEQGGALRPNNENGDAWFGYGVALSGDGNTALIGGPLNRTDKAPRGAAWTFVRSKGAWNQAATLHADEPTGEAFGEFVVLSASGKTAVIGGGDSHTSLGAAWQFTAATGVWAQQGSEFSPRGASKGVGFSSMALSAADPALIIGSSDENGKAGASWMAQIGTAASGHVYGVECTDAGCRQSGMAGVTILISGKTTKGVKVDTTLETGADGSWSTALENGAYKIGPTNDGSTLIGDAFDPASRAITADGSDQSDLDFKSCIDNQNRPAGMRPERRDVLPKGAEFCTSVYNFTVSAKIPSAVLVDPSPYAHYNQNSNPDVSDYRADTGWVNYFSQTAPIRGLLGKSRQYPECLPDSLEEEFSKDGTVVHWYSYIKTGGYKNPLGTVKVPIAWNQDTGTAKVLSQGPTVVKGNLTKVFKYRYTDPKTGQPVQSQCTQDETGPRQVQMLVWPVAGGNGVEPGMPNSEFSIFVAWGFPFTSTGVRMEEEPTLVGTTLKAFGGLGSSLYQAYERLSPSAKFLLDFLLGAVLGEGWIHLIEGAASKLVSLAHGLEYLEAYGGLTAKLFHGIKVVQDIAGFASSYSGEYPIMDAVVRGQFTTLPIRTRDLATGKVSRTKNCEKTGLAVSVKTTQFPTISLQVSRAAEPTATQGKVYEGRLPWKSTPAVLDANPKTTNPFDKNPETLLTNIAHNGVNYRSGKSAVEAITSETEDNPKVRKSLMETDTLDGDYTAEVNSAEFPSCSFDAKPAGTSTICWIFEDGKA